MSAHRSQVGGLIARLVVPVILVLAACTDTKIVEVTRPPYNPPPDSAAGFLGYYDVTASQTTCGNCHVGQQVDWSGTAHASAWVDLQNSGHAQASCEGCHTVNSRGNQPLAKVGFDSVKTDVYHDVQCEACHGPGLNHVKNPTIVANRPIPSINVYPPEAPDPAPPTAQDTANIVNSSCGGCHTDMGTAKHHNYLKEWKSSRHGTLNDHAAPNSSCQPCHEGKGALAAWGVNTVYKELGSSTLLPQNCPVCHDPHGSAKDPSTGLMNEGQLRFPITSPVLQVNLCTHCHNRIPEPSPTNSRGPHGAQGPMVFGTAGYFPPGTVYDTTAILTTHGSDANPRLCAGCHVNKQTGVDANGNSVTFSGHSFHPLPCLMQKTPPVVDTTFTNDCAYDVPSRSWIACTASGCHGSEAVAQSRLIGIWTERDGYVNTLWIDANHNQAVDPFPTDSGYLAKIKLNAPGELVFCNLTGTSNLCKTAADSVNSQRLTPAKGALFNAQLTGEALASHPDGSHGVHNPFLYRALLQSSIADLLANYGGFLPAPPAQVMAEIQRSVQSGTLKLAPSLTQAVLNPTVVSASVAGTR